MTNHCRYGYIREGSRGHNVVACQTDTMLKRGIERQKIFIDKKVDIECSNYQALKKLLREGDILYINDLNDLGRNKETVLQEWVEVTTDINAHIVVLNVPGLDTTMFKVATERYVKELVTELLSWFADDARRRILEAQRRGLSAAKNDGKVGRKPTEVTEEFLKAYEAWRAGEISTKKAMELSKLKRTTFYNVVKRYEADKK